VGLFEFIVGIAGAQSSDVGAADMRLGSKTIIYFISLSRFAQVQGAWHAAQIVWI